MQFFSRKRWVGVVDTRGTRISGWVYDRRGEGPVTVEVFLDGRLAGSVRADRHRPDLVAVASQGACAFEFQIPESDLDGTTRTVEVRPHGSSEPLVNGRFQLHLTSSWYHLGLVRWIFRSGWWFLDGERRRDTLQLKAHFILPPGVSDGRILIDGRAVDLSAARPAQGWKCTLPPDMAVRTLDMSVPIPAGAKHIHLSFGAQRSFRVLDDLYVPLFDVPLPEADRRTRVAGSITALAFDLYGYSNAIKLDTLAQRYGGKRLADIGPVLDWGCGCGRVARFVKGFGTDLSGADIDHDNASWCRANIGGDFIGISTEPPTPFSDNHFAAIYGISIFTHLTRQAERQWLTELHRIARPGALLLLSVHGGMAAANAGMLEHIYPADRLAGFVDLGRNSDIDVVTKGGEYYRNVFHQPGYIAEVWGEFFEILAIEEGIMNGAQDLVIARKPLAS